MIKLRAILGRRWLLILLTTLIGTVAGVISSQFATSGDSSVEKSYTASQTIIANRDSLGAGLVPQDELKITRGAVPAMAVETLDSKEDPEELASKITTQFDNVRSSITVSSDDTDQKKAEARVDAFVQAFLDTTNAKANEARDVQRQIEKDQLTAAEDALREFDLKNPQINAKDFVNDGTVATSILIQERQSLATTIEAIKQRNRQSELSASEIAPYQTLGQNLTKPSASGLLNVPTSPTVRSFLLGLLGLLLGGVVTMLIERVNRRIDTREELAELINLPILAEIGYVRQKKRHQDVDGALLLTGVWAEPYRRVRSAIQFVQATDRPLPGQVVGPDVSEPHSSAQVFLVTSTSPGEGKSTSAALTALALAEVGNSTLVVGGDFRKPMVDRLLGVTRDPSVQDFAKLDIDRLTVDEVVHNTAHASLYVAPAGPATREVAPLVEAAKELVEIACDRGATVIIDSSPLQAANDTLDLLPVVDYVILVLRAGRSGEVDLLDSIETMNRMGTRILGIILIGTPIGRKQAYYYDYYTPDAGPMPMGAPVPQAPVAPTPQAAAHAAPATAVPADPTGVPSPQPDSEVVGS